MAFGLFELFEEVDRRIARALARIGVTGSTIDAGTIGGSLPPSVLPDLAGDVTGPPVTNVVEAIQGVEVDPTPPTAGQVITAIDADSAEWADPATPTPLTVQEVDGTPTETPTTTLQFPNGTLTEPAPGQVRYTPTADTDEKAKVSSNDTTPGYLNGKLVAGTNIILTENNDGSNETLTIAASASPPAAGSLESPHRPNPGAAQGGLFNPLLQDPAGIADVTNDTSYNAFPGLVQMGDGRLLLTYRESVAHVGDKGVIKGKISADLGKTWGTEFTVYSDATYDAASNTLTRLASGRLVMTLTLYDQAGPAALLDGVYTIYSDDHAASWSSPVQINSSFTAWAQGLSPVVELDDGTLVLALYGRNSGDSTDSSHAVFSTDQAGSWGGEVTIATGSGRDWNEPWIVKLFDGSLVCFLRSDTGTDTIHKSVSTDSGATWGATATVFTGSGSPAAIVLSDGTILLAYRKAGTADAVYAVSTDSGATWGAEITIEATSFGQGYLYAQWCELADSGGNVALVYAMEKGTTNADVRYTVYYRGATTSVLTGAGISPRIYFAESSAPATPPSGFSVLYVATDGTLHIKDDAAVDTELGATASLALDDLTDVVLTSPAAGQVLTFDGADWVNDDLPATGTTDHEHMVDAFVGDGSTTVFELTDEPFDPEQVVAFASGAEVAITLSGTLNTTVTFAVAPSAAARVTIMYPAVAA